MSNKLYSFFNINKLNKKINTIINKLSFRNSPEKSTFELNEEKIKDDLADKSIIYHEEETKVDYEYDADSLLKSIIDSEDKIKIDYEDETKIDYEDETKIDSVEETKIDFEEEYYVCQSFSCNDNYYLLNKDLTKCTCKAYKYCKTSIKTCKHLEFCINLKNNNEKVLINMKKSTILDVWNQIHGYK